MLMKMVVLLVFACTVLVLSEDNASEHLDFRNGLFYEVSFDVPYTGLYLTKYDNGQIKDKRTFKDGKYHGLSEEYYDNGQLKVKGTYLYGKRDSLFEWYF